MKIDTDDLLNSILENLDKVSYIDSAEIPNIDLYVDQVTTFMDKHLKESSASAYGEKIMTKTMINNYAKNELLPAPVKKKYSKEHILVLIFIYYFKNIMSISDIQNVLGPLTDKYFGKESGITIKDIYDEVVKLDCDEIENLKKDVKDKYEKSQKAFTDKKDNKKANAKEADSDDKFLQLFSFICMLAFDVYVKKQLIEKMLEDFVAKQESPEPVKKSRKNKE